MPRIEASTEVDIPAEQAFAMSQSQGDVRYAWDPFVREQRLLDGAAVPARGVRTRTLSRHRLTMVSEYTSFRPPSQVGMKMVEGPWFFASFGGGWSFRPLGDDRTEAVWRYTFSIRPRWLAPLVEPIGERILRRDIERRLAGFAAACADPELIAAAVAQLDGAE